MAKKVEDRRWYSGIQGVKAAGVSHEYTPEEVKEYIKCANDPVYFINNYVQIVSLDKGLIPFKMYPFQSRIIDAVHSNRRTIAMLFRQAGKSTIMAAYLLWYATFNERKTAVMLANKMKIAQEIFSKIREAHTHLPAFLQQGVVEWNKSSLKYENGSRIVTAATSPTAVRGMSANLLMLDEFAFLEDNLADEFIASVFPTLSSSKESKLVIVSTPNGVNNAFHKIWVGAEQGTNGFVNVKGHWSEARDQEWADEQLKALGEVKFNAEVLCVDGQTQLTVFDTVEGIEKTITIEQLYNESNTN